MFRAFIQAVCLSAMYINFILYWNVSSIVVIQEKRKSWELNDSLVNVSVLPVVSGCTLCLERCMLVSHIVYMIYPWWFPHCWTVSLWYNLWIRPPLNQNIDEVFVSSYKVRTVHLSKTAYDNKAIMFPACSTYHRLLSIDGYKKHFKLWYNRFLCN